MTSDKNKNIESFYVDAVLFDMDGTLVDSIAAVEAAWGAVAEEIGQDPDYVIAATHGKRAVDNLKQFKPHIKEHEMDQAVVDFEKTILEFADGSRTPSRPSSRRNSKSSSRRPSQSGSRRPSQTNSRRPSESLNGGGGGGVSAFGLAHGLSKLSTLDKNEGEKNNESAIDDDDDEPRPSNSSPAADSGVDLEDDAENVEEEAFDGSIRILPGVRNMIDAIPKGKYAVATSSARTYAYGAMERVGIVPPEVTVTAEHPALKRGKPHPDPFLLAAKLLGYDPKKCLVVEDSPSGIRAAVASGGTTIAVCTSHAREKIKDCGAQYLLDDLRAVTVEHEADGRLKVTIDHSFVAPPEDEETLQHAHDDLRAAHKAGKDAVEKKKLEEQNNAAATAPAISA